MERPERSRRQRERDSTKRLERETTTERDTREIQGEEELGGLGNANDDDDGDEDDLPRALLRQTDSKEKVLGGCCRRGVT
jgi:hypothetical protein